jgi:hypothetical protein
MSPCKARQQKLLFFAGILSFQSLFHTGRANPRRPRSKSSSPFSLRSGASDQIKETNTAENPNNQTWSPIYSRQQENKDAERRRTSGRAGNPARNLGWRRRVSDGWEKKDGERSRIVFFDCPASASASAPGQSSHARQRVFRGRLITRRRHRVLHASRRSHLQSHWFLGQTVSSPRYQREYVLVGFFIPNFSYDISTCLD